MNNRSIDFIDPCRITTVKDLYCFHRTGTSRLEFLIRHRKLVSKLKLGQSYMHFYNKLITDLTHNELKLVILMTLDRIGMKSIFDKKKFKSGSHLNYKVKTVYDLMKVYECIVTSLHNDDFSKKDIHMDLYNYRPILKGINIHSYGSILSQVSFYSPPENYWGLNHYHGSIGNIYKRSKANYFSGYEIQYTGLKSVGLTCDSYAGTYYKSRPFRENSIYPFIKSSECTYRMRDLMFFLDQNTCNAWIKRYNTKLKLFKMSEIDMMEFLHKPIELLTPEDIILGEQILSYTPTYSKFLGAYKCLIEDSKYKEFINGNKLLSRKLFNFVYTRTYNLKYTEDNDEPYKIHRCLVSLKK